MTKGIITEKIFKNQGDAESYAISLMGGDIKPRYCQYGIYPRKLMQVYYKMKNRCYLPKEQNYKYYGALGVMVCDEWLSNPTKFYEWATTNGFTYGLQLDRINCFGNYEPSNCRFVTRSVNNRNRREQSREDVGVHYCSKKNNFAATIGVNGKRITVGRFKDKQEAINARKSAELKYWHNNESQLY